MEFDDQEWEKREWVKVYEDFQLFLLEHQLVWAKRKEGAGGGAGGGGAAGLLQATKAKHIQWPALVRPLFRIYRLDTVKGAVTNTPRLSVTFNADRSVDHLPLNPCRLNTPSLCVTFICLCALACRR